MDYKVCKEFSVWLYPESSGQQLNVQMEISDKCCPLDICVGSSTV